MTGGGGAVVVGVSRFRGGGGGGMVVVVVVLGAVTMAAGLGLGALTAGGASPEVPVVSDGVGRVSKLGGAGATVIRPGADWEPGSSAFTLVFSSGVLTAATTISPPTKLPAIHSQRLSRGGVGGLDE
ncbi:MAG TPA: hypothetical protein VJT49_00460 [Amycolatopsis sp.]|uniref:hypothetical protein n=1 Tax=Amycolatopsis sp. TaxID=37632 RepID=UPI002B45FD4B|nr:hypothetical protein [Amycolatopsis sp.]HKS43586.1 hypothetical protein [Amycolatopsis sp.]